MEKLKDGYKKTELGIIPEEWEITSLENLGTTYNGLSGKNKEHFGKGKPFIPYKNIFSNTKIDISYLDFVMIDEDEAQNKVQYGDVFFTTSSETAEEVGYTSVLLDDLKEAYLNSFCFGYRLNNFNKVRPEFLRYLLRSQSVRKSIIKIAQGYTRFNLSKLQVLKISIPIPPIMEQLKIAAILSTVDDLIENTAHLINSYILLKKGLMQILLTKGIGHTKFKKTEIGIIPEEWEVKRIKDIANVIIGGTPNRNNPAYWDRSDASNNVWVSIKDLSSVFKFISNSSEYISDLGVENSNVKLIKKNTVLMSFKLTIGKVAITKQDLYTNEAIAAFQIKNENEIDYNYLYYKLPSLKYDLDQAIKGQTLNKEKINNAFIPIPPLQEQNQIASILSSVDDRLELYKSKKEKLNLLKKGLMQQLLTGKIRVKV